MSLHAGINGNSKRISAMYISINGMLKNISTMYSNEEVIYQDKIDIDKELDKINPIKALTSGQITEEYLGRTVLLSNGSCTCQEWIIIGVNCQKEVGSVDLISKSTLWNKCGESGGQPNAKTYVGYDNSGSASGSTDMVDGTSTSSIQYYLNNQVITGFSKEIQEALQPMSVEYLDSYVSGDKGGDYNRFYRTQKICVPGDEDIRLYLENGTVIVESFSGGGSATWRTDTYCGYGRNYFDHHIKWNTSTSGGIEYNTSVFSYDTAQLLAISKTPKGEQVKYSLRSCVFDSSYSRYYINTSGRRATTYSASFDSSYNVGAIIRLANPNFANLNGIDPIDYLKSGKINDSYLGRRVYLSMSDGTTSTWVIVNISSAGVTLLNMSNTSSTKFDSNKGNIYESSSIRSYLNDTFYNQLSDKVRNAMKYQTYVSNGKTFKDKVVLPSATELGFSSNSSVSFRTEGNPFQFFELDPKNYYNYISKSTWTRTADASSSDKAIEVYNDAQPYNTLYNYAYLPCIMV